jgi:sugar lactone lactonase YvrE
VKRYSATVASDQVYVLAEGPTWDGLRRRLLWVDINGHHVLSGELDGERVVETGRLTFEGTVGAVACSPAGDLLVAGPHGLITVPAERGPSDDADHTADTARSSDPIPVEPDTGGIRLIPPDRRSRLNDGGCDPAGRFLVGTMALDDRKNQEQLVRIETSGEVTVIDDGLGLSNGLAWSPDGAWFYSIDTDAGLIWVRSYDSASGACGPRREHLRITNGHPDGMCMDAEGNLWVAIWGAGQVRCFSPDGEHLASVSVPAPNTSSVAFAGPGLDTLVITTASEQLSAAQLDEYPDAGKLFTASVGVAGLPVPYWAGS